MTQAGKNYALILESLPVSAEDVKESQRLFQNNANLVEALSNPLIARIQKEQVIERIFPTSMQNFLKVLCAHGRAEEFTEIVREYENLRQKRQGILKASLTCVTEPTVEQKQGIEEFLKKTYQKSQVFLEIHQDQELIGGFILQAEGDEYDWSLRGRLQRMEQTLIRR